MHLLPVHEEEHVFCSSSLRAAEFFWPQLGGSDTLSVFRVAYYRKYPIHPTSVTAALSPRGPKAQTKGAGGCRERVDKDDESRQRREEEEEVEDEEEDGNREAVD